MCFDECPPGEAPRTAVEEAVRRTGLWATRCKEAHLQAGGLGSDGPQMLLGIVQGGTHLDLRARSVEELCESGFPGYAIGGLSVGEERGRMLEVTAHIAGLLPHDKVRYFMGIGDPAGVLEVIDRGIDLFDCVLPTRTARMGTAFTSEGRVNLRNACHVRSMEPLEPGCPCTACRTFSRGVLRHLVVQKEILALELLSEHNLTFMIRLVTAARQAIMEGRFAEYKRECSARS
jgi:queuine tRNA-ribosyltransferase